MGGDGTVREVIDGLLDTGVPMVVWPTGTENLVAKAFGFRRNPKSILKALTDGIVRPIDVGVANGKPFLILTGVGFDAEVVHRLARARQGHITHLTYGGPIWRTFWEHRFPAVRVLADGQPYWEGRGLVFVGNIARYSLGLRVIRDAVPDDGLLDLCIFPCRHHIDLLAHSFRTLAGVQIEYGGVKYRRCQRIRVEASESVPVEIDGDNGGYLPINIHVRPAAVLVKVPPEKSPR
jgi:diacylglycerol kinase family enzyme